MQNIFKREKTLAELEEEREHEESEVSLLRQKVLRRELENKMGKGSLKYFKGEDGRPVWSKVYNWIKTH